MNHLSYFTMPWSSSICIHTESGTVENAKVESIFSRPGWLWMIPNYNLGILQPKSWERSSQEYWTYYSKGMSPWPMQVQHHPSHIHIPTHKVRSSSLNTVSENNLPRHWKRTFIAVTPHYPTQTLTILIVTLHSTFTQPIVLQPSRIP